MHRPHVDGEVENFDIKLKICVLEDGSAEGRRSMLEIVRIGILPVGRVI
jgi:hypothetical protein